MDLPSSIGTAPRAGGSPAPPLRGGSGGPRTVIESLGVYLPEASASTREILAGCERLSPFQRTHPARIERLLGIRRRRIAAEGETALDMAKSAIVKCFAMSRHGPADIDLLLSCGISRYQTRHRMAYEPTLSLRLAGHFGFAGALALDIGNGCAGMFTAIHIVDALIKARVIRRGLIVSGERITDLMRTAQKEVTGYSDPRFACLTLGDAAAALILEEAAAGSIGFHDIELFTAGRYSDYCIGKPTSEAHGGVIMLTDSARLFSEAIRHSAADLLEALDRHSWGREQVDHLILHQTHQGGIDAVSHVNRLAREEVFHAGNVVNNLPERGNTASTSHFVALRDGILAGRIRPGHRVLFGVQGSGLTIGTAAYTLDDLPDRVRRAEGNGHVSPAPPAPGRTRAILEGGAPRVRIESLGVADARDAPGSGLALARKAVERCLAGSRYTRESVDLLIFAGVHRDDFIGEPAIAAMIAGRAGLNESGRSSVTGKRTFAFDVFNSSIGFLNACYLGAGMIQSHRADSVMIVASEIENNAAIPGGDASGIAEVGSAVILDRAPDGGAGFGRGVFESFTGHLGAVSSWLSLEEGTARMRFARPADPGALYLECIPATVGTLLEREGIGLEEIAVILPPQIARGFVPRLAAALGVGADRFVDVARDGLSLFSSSLAYSLSNVGRVRTIRSGDLGLIINVGTGVQVGAATYRF